MSRVKRFLRRLGPGLITGASDDDPSGIATYSQVGAAFGPMMLWTMLFSAPLMVAIQDVSARIGVITGRGLTANIKRLFPRWAVMSLVFLFVGANVLNIGADIQAMGAVAAGLTGIPVWILNLAFTVVTLYLQIFVPYHRYVRYLKGLAAVLVVYVITAFVARAFSAQALLRTFVPVIHFEPDYFLGFMAVLGTTLSPYLLVWQESEEVEELERKHARPLMNQSRRRASAVFRRIDLDTILGMVYSNVVAWFIIVCSAATLHANGIRNIETAQQAAQALRPLAGPFAFLLFSLGIIGTGLLSIPVLAGSAAYSIAEIVDAREGLERQPSEAKAFYGFLAAAMVLGYAVTFSGVPPMRALYWAAVVNGIVSVPVMAGLMVMTRTKHAVNGIHFPRILKVAGWTTAAVMALVAGGLLWQSLFVTGK